MSADDVFPRRVGPRGPDDWKAEYDQLSQDFRHYVTMGWQATVAVLLADGVVLGLAADRLPSWQLSFVYAISAGLTILMGLETMKWNKRAFEKALRLQEIDRERSFRRFYPEEKGFRTWRLGNCLFLLMMLVALSLSVLAITNYLDFPSDLIIAVGAAACVSAACSDQIKNGYHSITHKPKS